MANSYPSPIAKNTGSPDFPTTANLGWAAPNMQYFHDISNKIPGSVGPVRYFPTNPGAFKGAKDAYIEIDSGVLFNDWQRYVARNTNF